MTVPAYHERSKRPLRRNESLSDVVRRLTEGTSLETYYGALSEETADELEEFIAERRNERAGEHRERVERIADAFE
ncbi:antitoxin VapB family protein [Natrialbaceae archaeon GCM10025810]|uniref:antitoxin VapB family protein n=1 Tax=Halovalidus salilacus TaxID=3075124 RepID=UPI003618C01E